MELDPKALALFTEGFDKIVEGLGRSSASTPATRTSKAPARARRRRSTSSSTTNGA